jgi:hypothetical protein
MSNARDLADLADDATTVPTAAGAGNPNLIINGGMTVSQRGTSFSNPLNNAYLLDRWNIGYSAGTLNVDVTQDANGIFAAWGLDYSLKVDIQTAEAAIAAGEFCYIQQRIEAQNLQHLEFGAAGAQDLTLRFLVQSPKSGTHNFSLYQPDGTRSYQGEFTVTSADTPEEITHTISGDTSGTINNDNGSGLELNITLAAGSTYQSTADTWTAGQDFGTSSGQNLLDNTANNFYLGGVKLEAGSSATSFEHESYGDTLAKCQRYYYRRTESGTNSFVLGTGWTVSATRMRTSIFHPVSMRAEPTLDKSAIADFVIRYQAATTDCTSFQTTYNGSVDTMVVQTDCASVLSTGDSGLLMSDGAASGWYSLSAEL